MRLRRSVNKKQDYQRVNKFRDQANSSVNLFQDGSVPLSTRKVHQKYTKSTSKVPLKYLGSAHKNLQIAVNQLFEIIDICSGCHCSIVDASLREVNKFQEEASVQRARGGAKKQH